MSLKQILVGVLLLLFFFTPTVAAEKININTASVEELASAGLYRITTSQATKIVEYRETQSLFVVIEDIMKVSGIKEATFAKIKDFITVGESTPDPIIQNNDDDEDFATTTTSDDGPSTHSSPAELSDLLEEKSTLSVSAGRDRMVATGSRTLFKASAKGLKDGGNNADFYWNFGDGMAARGQGLYHTYRYAGTYNVVLTLNQTGNEAVSRIMIKVVDPKIKLQPKESKFGEAVVEIKNLAEEEINLGEWRLADGRGKFVLPVDTIVARGSSINLPFSANGEIKLIAPSEQIFAKNYQFGDGSDWQNLRQELERLVATSKSNQLANVPLVGTPVVVAFSQLESTLRATSSSIELPAKRNWWSRLVDKIF